MSDLIDPAVLDRFEETTWEDMKGRVQRALTGLLDAHSYAPQNQNDRLEASS